MHFGQVLVELAMDIVTYTGSESYIEDRCVHWLLRVVAESVSRVVTRCCEAGDLDDIVCNIIWVMWLGPFKYNFPVEVAVVGRVFRTYAVHCHEMPTSASDTLDGDSHCPVRHWLSNQILEICEVASIATRTGICHEGMSLLIGIKES